MATDSNNFYALYQLNQIDEKHECVATEEKQMIQNFRLLSREYKLIILNQIDFILKLEMEEKKKKFHVVKC